MGMKTSIRAFYFWCQEIETAAYYFFLKILLYPEIKPIRKNNGKISKKFKTSFHFDYGIMP